MITRKFRWSIGLGSTLVVLVHYVFAQFECAPNSYFASDMFAERYRGMAKYHAEKPIDAIAIGNSHTTNAVDVTLLEELSGIRCYNFGIPSSDIHFQALVLRDILIPHYKPKYVLWEIDDRIHSVFHANTDRIESPAVKRAAWPGGSSLVALESKLLHYQRRSITEWIETVDVPRNYLYDPGGFLAGFGRIDLKVAGERRQRRPPGMPRQSKLQKWFEKHSLAQQVPRRKRREVVKRFLDESPYTTEQAMKAIDGAMATAKEHGTVIKMFSTPFFFYYYNTPRAPAKKMRAYRKWLRKRFEQYGVEYLNMRFSRELSQDQDKFADLVHMNGEGAKEFTRLLYEFLLEPGAEVPPHYRGLLSEAEKAAFEHYSNAEGR